MRLLGSYIFVSFQQIIYKHGNFTNFKAFFLVVSMYSRCQVFFKFMKKTKQTQKQQQQEPGWIFLAVYWDKLNWVRLMWG